MNITRNESGEVTQQGTLTRVTHGAPAPQSEAMQAPHESIRVGAGTVRYSAATGAQSGGLSRYQAGAESPRTGSVMATMQRLNGAQTVELEPGNAASRTDVATALRLGLVRESFPGIYEDLQAAQQEAAQAREQAPQEPQQEAGEQVFAPEEDSIWTEEISPLSQGAYDLAVAGTVAGLVDGSGNFDKATQALMQEPGMTPERAREFVDTGVEFYTRTLTADLVRQGLVTNDTAQTFYDSLQGHPRLNEALQQFATQRRPDVFRELAVEFKRTTAEATAGGLREQLSRHGLEVTVDRATGDIMTKGPGGNWRALSKLA